MTGLQGGGYLNGLQEDQYVNDEPPALGQHPRQSSRESRGAGRTDSKASRQVSELNFQKEWWMDALVKLVQEQLANQGKQLQVALTEDLGGVVRRTVTEEVGALLAEGGHVRCAVRSEVEAALKSWRDQAEKATPRPARVRSSQPGRAREEGKAAVQGGQGGGAEGADADGGGVRRGKSAGDLRRSNSIESATGDHIADFVQTAGSDHLANFGWGESGFRLGGDGKMWRAVLRRYERLRAWLRGLEEPARHGRFARFVDGKVLEAAVCITICLNFAFMVYTANVEIQNPREPDRSVFIGNWAFQAFYTLEMFLKLVVHRQWFFVAEHWKMNICDFTLMASGFLILNTGSGGGGSILRMLRFLKFGKSLRALRVMSHLKHLRGLLLCLQGSFMNLFWTVVLLFVVYLIFSLFLMQIITEHLQASGGALKDSVFDEDFGSVEASVLTLYKASTGGDDWSMTYDTIEVAGGLGTVVYLIFIFFVQFALMNIITSIFVESAMVTLSPDSEMLAREHASHEQENAMKLEKLCIEVDSDFSGKLTQKQFEDGLNRQHIPMLLSMLGLQRHHVLEFFARMANAANDDGQVEISKFVSGCMLLKGSATNFDLHQLHAELHQLHAEVQAQQAMLDQSLSDMSQLLRDSLEPPEDDNLADMHPSAQVS